MTIPERRFLQFSLFLPLVAPFAALPLGTGRQPSLGTELYGVLLVSLVFGGVPYLIFGGALLWWARGKSVGDLLWVAWLTPLLFACVATPTVGGVMAYVTGPSARWENALFYGVMSLAYALVLGYSYVCAVLAARWLLDRAGLLRREQAARE